MEDIIVETLAVDNVYGRKFIIGISLVPTPRGRLGTRNTSLPSYLERINSYFVLLGQRLTFHGGIGGSRFLFYMYKYCTMSSDPHLLGSDVTSESPAEQDTCFVPYVRPHQLRTLECPGDGDHYW